MFLISGHSGCKIELFRTDSKSIVRKTSSSSDYNDRLKKQCQKQSDFYDIISRQKIPKVLNESELGLYSFEMEYVPYKDSITFLNTASKKDVDKFCENVFDIIDTCIKLSEVKTIDSQVYESKFDSTASKIEDKVDFLFLKRCEKIFSNIKKSQCYVGVCHGDLTLSNLLISSNINVCLIDFLDSYLESPIQDIVKIRQDTKYYWSQSLYSGEFDKKRMSILMDYMDNLIVQKYEKFEFYNNLYKPTQLLNLLRLLPYIRNEQKFASVLQLCRGVLDEY